jgi:hypothetical protein
LHSLPNYEQVKFNCDIEKHALDAPMQQYVATMKLQEDMHRSNPKTSAFHDFDLYPHSAVCAPGQLTPIGASQHVHNGAFLKKRYVNALGLFGNDADVKLEDRVLIRSTPILRTFQSAAALLFGFLPEFDMSKLSFEMVSECRLCHESSAGVACDCPSIVSDMDGMAAAQHQFTPAVMAAKRTRATYEQISDVLGVMVGQVPRPSHVFDVSMVHVCHSENLPGPKPDICLPAWSVYNMYNILNDNGKQQVTTMKYQKTARLKMYPLVREILQHMVSVMEGDSSTVFHLYSGHDSTIEPLAAALNMSDGHWPRYASRIVFELYSTRTKASKLFLFRVLYDGAVMTAKLPCCVNNMYKAPNMGLCELKHLQRYIMQDFLKILGHNGDYVKLCTERD